MPLWPFRRRRRVAVSALSPDALLVTEDLLRRNVEDIFIVRERGSRGHAFLFGGELLLEPPRALTLLEARLKPLGYTPFLLPLRSTLMAGSLVAGSLPFVTFDPRLEPHRLLDGLPFAATLLGILGTHEFGHYFTARAYGASVSLPYFIPAPPPLFLFGTLGAVIRMRSPVRDRNSLFDIAAAGPLAGLVVAIPALWLGLGWSRVGVVPDSGAMAFGDSLLLRAMTYLMFGRIPEGMDVFIHPVALAGWVGLFVTALNLFPVGQLDGGRIAYALFGVQHRRVSVGTVLALLLLGAVTGSAHWPLFARPLTFLSRFSSG